MNKREGKKAMRKRGIVATLFSVTAIITSSVTLSACGNGGSGENGEDGTNDWNGHTHKYETEITEATCEGEGKEVKKCECGEIISEERIAPLGHEWGEYIYDGNSTCTENGTETAKCIRCEQTETKEKINTKTGHNYGEYVYNNDATCENDGTETSECKACKHQRTRIKENSKLEHEIQTTSKDATCEESGYIIKQCGNCEYYVYEEIPAIGHDNKLGVCNTCGKRDYETPTKGLKYEGNTVTRESDEVMEYTVIVIVNDEGITTIQEQAFNGCKMEEIVIPSNITEIGANAFEGCERLEHIELPNGVKRIEDGTFNGCSGLNEITIPASVEYIGELAFYGCGETVIKYMGTLEQWESITFGEEWNEDAEITLVFLG